MVEINSSQPIVNNIAPVNNKIEYAFSERKNENSINSPLKN